MNADKCEHLFSSWIYQRLSAFITVSSFFLASWRFTVFKYTMFRARWRPSGQRDRVGPVCRESIACGAKRFQGPRKNPRLQSVGFEGQSVNPGPANQRKLSESQTVAVVPPGSYHRKLFRRCPGRFPRLRAGELLSGNSCPSTYGRCDRFVRTNVTVWCVCVCYRRT